MEFKDKYSWGGWPNCVYISNGRIDIVATTDIGPRIMRAGFSGERNLLLELKEDMGKTGGEVFRPYGGSRLWHSPEANPRSYMPDNEPVSYEWDKKTLKLTQTIEAKTGMQKEIMLKMSDSENKIEYAYRIYNKGIWPVNYALWALTQMAVNGRAIIPQEPYKSWNDDLLPARPLVLWSYTEMNDPRWTWGKKYIQLKQDIGAKGPTKCGLLNKLCWMAYCLEGYVLIKRYQYDSCSDYPDFQCNTQVYTDAKLFELETLSPLKTIKPGGYSEHKENWYIFKADISSEDEDSIDQNLMPLILKTEKP